MIDLVCVLMVCAIVVMIIRLFYAKDVFVKIMSVNVITSYVVALLSVVALQDKDKMYFLDVALVYACLGVVVSIAFLKYFSYKR